METFKITEQQVREISQILNRAPTEFGRPILNFFDQLMVAQLKEKQAADLKEKEPDNVAPIKK